MDPTGDFQAPNDRSDDSDKAASQLDLFVFWVSAHITSVKAEEKTGEYKSLLLTNGKLPDKLLLNIILQQSVINPDTPFASTTESIDLQSF